ncbi:MAG: flagellin [bacterium]|nr:flagellin [bacterium]
MSVRINHNKSALNAHRNLLANETALRGSLEKLSSGLKINRASDGPAQLVISEQMRAQVASVNQAVTNNENAISVIQTTEGALNEVNRLLVSMRQLSIHASNEGMNDEVMLQADQLEISNALQSLDRIAAQTQFGKRKLLDGSNGATGVAIGNGVEFLGASVKTQASDADGYDVVVTKNATRSQVVGKQALTEEAIAAGEEFTIIEGGKIARFKAESSDNVKTAVQRLSSAVKDSGLDVEVSLNEQNQLVVTHKQYGSGQQFQVSSTSSGLLSDEGGAVQTIDNGQDIEGSINGETTSGKGQVLTGSSGTANVEGLKVGFWGRAGTDGDIPEGGVKIGSVAVSNNSLTFQIGGNQGQTASVSLFDTSSKSLGKGVENDSGFASLRDIDVRNFDGAQDSLRLIDQAINDITSIRGELGAFQKNTLESNLSNLRIASENLVAAESTIRDTDMAMEMASFTRNQIMVESATAMLSHANNMPNSIMKLLG